MKKLILILFCLIAVSCTRKIEYELVTLKLKSVDGTWSTATYDLPKGSTFYVQSFYGGYTLHYSYGKGIFTRGGQLMAACIDYKVVKRWGKTLKK